MRVFTNTRGRLLNATGQQYLSPRWDRSFKITHEIGQWKIQRVSDLNKLSLKAFKVSFPSDDND